MTDYVNTYETGLAAGTALTVANSDDGSAGDAFAAVVGGTQQFTATNVLFGTRALSLNHAASTSAYHSWSGMVGGSPSFALDVYFYMAAVPTTNDQVLCALYRGSSGVAPILIRTNGSLRVTSDAAAGAAIMASATGVFTAGGYYRVQVWGTANGASGTLNFRAYSVNPTTKVETEIVPLTTSTTANLGTGNIDQVRWGNSVNFAPAYTWVYDVSRFRTGAATPFTAYADAVNVAPTANAGPDQTTVEPWSTVTLSGSGSTDSDGTIASYAWTQTSGTAVTLSGSGASRTFVAPASLTGATLTFSLTVTDDDGAASTADTVTVTVLAATEAAAVGGALVPMQTLALVSGSLQ